MAHAPDALQAAISMLMEKGMDIPAPGKARRNAVLVPLPSVVASAKVELYRALRSAGVRKAELARRMGIHKQQVERLMDIDHTTRIEQLEAAFSALNKRLIVDILNAASQVFAEAQAGSALCQVRLVEQAGYLVGYLRPIGNLIGNRPAQAFTNHHGNEHLHAVVDPGGQRSDL